jgi:hypothetical protein
MRGQSIHSLKKALARRTIQHRGQRRGERQTVFSFGLKDKETAMRRLFGWVPLIFFMMLGGHDASAKDGQENNQRRDGNAPKFRVDADWPKPLPNQWLLGQVAGVAVDRHGHI